MLKLRLRGEQGNEQELAALRLSSGYAAPAIVSVFVSRIDR
jgi:hypothetical protein